jgi:flagellar FliJ protein
MARRFPLEPIREVLRQRTEDAATALQAHAGRLRAAELKRRELEGYLAEYEAMRLRILQEGANALRLRDFGVFLERIREAIDLQRIEEGRLRATWETARLHWEEQSRREHAIDVLAHRHAQREQVREGRAEQKLLDEFAARGHRAGQAGKAG